MRPVFVVLHRCLGLFIAVFLLIAGLTGAVISWDHELDEWLNPQLYHAARQGTVQQALELAAGLEVDDTRLLVTYLPLSVEPGHTLMPSVSPRLDPRTGKAFLLGFNQVAVNPVTGSIQGRREWGAVSLAPENLLPFLYKLHYSLHIPDAWGMELGVWFMGLVGIVWVFDNVIALGLSFPNPKTWRKSFAFRWRKGGYALTYDLHRSGGCWAWGLLLIIAVTSVGMNLNEQVMRPWVAVFSTLAPSPFADRKPNPQDAPIMPMITREAVIHLAETEARHRGWLLPAGAVFYSPELGIYGVGFFQSGNDHGDGGLGNPWLYFDGQTGNPAGAEIPGTGSAGDIFLQAQFPLHSGRILGLPGRVLISMMGLVVAMLSVTGLIIWWKKRQARVLMRAKRG
ncbi:MAG: PepSY-associated TM helix domain-containing protein [Methylovulum sp.]|nr:PepSY-associated TM helix domain-containing protein [Methylovulum sp.]